MKGMLQVLLPCTVPKLLGCYSSLLIRPERTFADALHVYKLWNDANLDGYVQDCGRPYYVEDYNAFYSAIKAVYPGITLIANCPLPATAPTELWDWHSYDPSWTMFERMHDFDNLDRKTQPSVFVSEYAVTVDGGWGNLRVSHLPCDRLLQVDKPGWPHFR